MAGSWATPIYDLVTSGSAFKTITLVFTADAANATIPNYQFPATALTFAKGLYIYSIKTTPGVTQPTNLYDIVLNDANSYDVLQSALLNRSATTTQQIFPTAIPFDEAFTIVVSNNAVNSATATIKFYLAR